MSYTRRCSAIRWRKTESGEDFFLEGAQTKTLHDESPTDDDAPLR